MFSVSKRPINLISRSLSLLIRNCVVKSFNSLNKFDIVLVNSVLQVPFCQVHL